jgi:hypothetical protein
VFHPSTITWPVMVGPAVAPTGQNVNGMVVPWFERTN